MLSAPRTDPDGPDSGIRLPPRVLDGEALFGPGMDNTRFREPFVNQPLHPLPVQFRHIAASGEDPIPTLGDLGSERHERPSIVRDGVVIEV